MGLDMYVYKASKPIGLQSDIVYNYNDLREQGYSMFEANDVENQKWFADLIPFSVRVQCIAEYYDIATISKKFGLGDNAHWSGFGPDGFYFIGNNKEIIISDEEIKQYCIKKQKDWYVTNIDEVAYWRKHYELQDALHSAYNAKDILVENCGYYVLDQKMLSIIRKMGKTEFGLEDYEKGTLLYHEWY